MSNNMTRKEGLAFGSGVALIASLLVTVPGASANENLSLSPSAGTGYDVLSTSEFVLETGFDASIAPDSYKYLKYRVVNDGEAEIVTEMSRGSSGGNESVFQTGKSTFANIASPTTEFLDPLGLEISTDSTVDYASSSDKISFDVATAVSLSEDVDVFIESFEQAGTDLASDIVTKLQADVLAIGEDLSDTTRVSVKAGSLNSDADDDGAAQSGTFYRANAFYDENVPTIKIDTETDFSSLSNGDFVLLTGLSTVGLASDVVAALEGVNEVSAGASDSITIKAPADLNSETDDYGAITAGNITPLSETYSVDEDDFVVAPASNDSAPAAAQGEQNTLTISTNNVDDNTTVTVQAWLDLDDDNTIDPGETVSPIRTINFYDRDDVTATASLESPVLGADTLTANVTFSPELNVQQLGVKDVVVKFLENNDAATVGSSAGVLTTNTEGYFYASYDSEEAVFDADLTNLDTNVTDSTVYGAEAYFWDGTGSGTADSEYEKSGTGTFSGVDAGEVSGLDAVTLVKGESANGSGASGKVRSGSGSLTVETKVSSVVTGADEAGQTVTLTIADSALTSGASVTAGGETLTSETSGGKITVEGVTDEDGEVTFEIEYAGFDESDGDAFTVEASALGDTGTVNSGGSSSADLTFTAQDSEATAVVDNIAGDHQLATAIGSNFTVNYTVVDQFGQTPVGEFRLVMSHDGNGSYSDTVAVSNGTASFTQNENSTSANDYTLTATAQKRNSSGTFINVGLTGTTEISANTELPTPLKITGVANPNDGSSTPHGLTLADMVNLDEDIAQSSVASPTTPSEYIDGTVTGAGGALLKGVEVTLTSPNIQFTSDDEKVHGAGSITVRTDSSGAYKAYIASRISGAQTINISAGGASVSEVVTFAAAADNTGASLNIDAPDAVASGSTLVFTAKLTDKYGNAVDSGQTNTTDVSVSYEGPGLRVGDLPTGFDSDGELTVRVLMGSGDQGNASLTVVYGGADRNINAVAAHSDNDDNIAVTKTVTVGEGTFTGTYGDVYAWTVDQGDGTAKVYVKFPTIGEKVRIGHQTGGSGSYETIYVKTTSSETMDGLRQVAGVGTYVVRTIDLESGTNRIRVDVGDDRLVQVRYNE